MIRHAVYNNALAPRLVGKVAYYGHKMVFPAALNLGCPVLYRKNSMGVHLKVGICHGMVGNWITPLN